MYCLSPSCSPSIRTWDMFNGETFAYKSSHRKVEELTLSAVPGLTRSTVDETVLAIPQRPGARGNTILCLQRELIFHIQVDTYCPK